MRISAIKAHTEGPLAGPMSMQGRSVWRPNIVQRSGTFGDRCFGRRQGLAGSWYGPAVLWALVLAMFLLTGCSAIFDGSYHASSPYQAPAQAETADGEDAAIDSISNYASLRRAITQLVADHQDSAQLQFLNYEGSISQDISTACWEVKSSTALGAFAVDYISYDLSRIVSYYQAEVNIAYKRSAAQVEALETISTMTGLSNRLEAAIAGGETYLVLGLNSATVTAATVREYVHEAYFDDPVLCPVLPEVEVSLYPESGVSRIAEVSLNYGLDGEELAQRREDLRLGLDMMTAAVDGAVGTDSDADRLDAMRQYLAGLCAVDESAGATAWDALTGGASSSQGLALAFAAGCRAMDIPCRTVSGRLGEEPHWWNIVTIGDASYHVDAAGDVFLAGDDQLWGAYWWDTSEYPACPAPYMAQASVEPAAEDEAEPVDVTVEI